MTHRGKYGREAAACWGATSGGSTRRLRHQTECRRDRSVAPSAVPMAESAGSDQGGDNTQSHLGARRRSADVEGRFHLIIQPSNGKTQDSQIPVSGRLDTVHYPRLNTTCPLPKCSAREPARRRPSDTILESQKSNHYRGDPALPLTDAQKNAFSTRLDSAYTQTRDLSETRPWAHEIVRDYGLGQDWPIVTAAYSGIEQTLKFLIALDRDITIQELIAIRAFRTHRLAFLFDHLSCENQRAAQRYYARWQSLYSHVDVATCEEFSPTSGGRRRRGIPELEILPHAGQASSGEQRRCDARHMGSVAAPGTGPSVPTGRR